MIQQVKLYYIDLLLNQLNSTNKTNYGPQSASRSHVRYVGTRRRLGEKKHEFWRKDWYIFFMHPLGVSDMYIFILLYLYYIYGYKRSNLHKYHLFTYIK